MKTEVWLKSNFSFVPKKRRREMKRTKQKMKLWINQFVSIQMFIVSLFATLFQLVIFSTRYFNVCLIFRFGFSVKFLKLYLKLFSGNVSHHYDTLLYFPTLQTLVPIFSSTVVFRYLRFLIIWYSKHTHSNWKKNKRQQRASEDFFSSRWIGWRD